VFYLETNTAAQTIRLSLNEARYFLEAYTHYLIILTSKATGETFSFVADVVSEDARITEITVSTATNNPSSSAVIISEGGQYIYTVYGQNSSTNTDPDNATVVGIAQRGQCVLRGNTTYFVESTTTVPDAEQITES
jgi:hypothetical protein